ncbi:MAG: AsmA family protein, partial [Alphaproteobacteria bacterium]|nr:AsmA family protein [Alphaproteobacteria bacterium]
IAAIAAERFEAATGRALSIGGDVRPSLWPTLGVSAEDITVAGADWSDRGPLLRAETMSVNVGWPALWGGEIRVTGASISGADVLLEVGPEGRGNWVFDAARPAETVPQDSAGAPTPLALDAVTLTGSRLRYFDASGKETAVTDIEAALALPSFSGPLGADLTARVGGQPIALQASIGGLAGLLAGQETALDMTLEAGDLSLPLSGQLALDPLTFTGQTRASLGRMQGLSALLGIAQPELPRGLGQDRIDVATEIAFLGDTLTLRGLNATLDQNTVSGDAEVTLGGARPYIAARLSAGALDLSALGGNEDQQAGTGATDASTGWSTEPIDASGLGALDGDITLSAASIAIGKSQLGRTSLTTKIDNARAVTTINQLVAYDGEVAGSFVVNARQNLSVRADLAGSAIAISRLFSELFDYDRLISIGDMTISVLGSGNSQNAIINSLNGNGTFEFGAGELIGWDLVGMLRSLDIAAFKTGKRTIFDSITGTFTIENGVVINDNLTFLSPLLEARGTGRVGLGGQTLNYRITPRLLTGERAGLSVPLVITGTWADPKFRLDLQALAEQEVGEEIEAAKEAAKAKVKEKVEKELGGATEDEIKKKLEEKAVGGLLKLLK